MNKVAMNKVALNKPTAVKVIGGLWIGFGSLAVCSSLLGYYVYREISGGVSGESPMGVVAYMPWLLIFQFLFGGFGIVASLEFLQMRRWARTALEWLTWTTITFLIATQALVLSNIFSMDVAAGEFGVIILVACIQIVAYIVPCAFVIRALRSAPIRDAFDQRRPSPPT